LIFENRIGDKPKERDSAWKKREKGLRPLGDRPVEWDISFVCNKGRTPGWGYVDESSF
jgi:hypothetical protein